MCKKQLTHLHKIIIPCLLGFLTMITVGCLEDYMEPIPPVNIDGMVDCSLPATLLETYRCNGNVVELCRAANGHTLWRPMEDCANVPGGTCSDPGDGTAPTCTGNYWETGYCPGDRPAATECQGIASAGCCDNQDTVKNKYLYCGDDGMLYCQQCWGDSYYNQFCLWSTVEIDDTTGEQEGYGCFTEDPNNPNIYVEADPTGTNPAACTP